MNKALIIGGCGFIGNNLIHFLVQKGHKIKVFDIEKPSRPIKSVEYIIGDILDQSLLEQSMKNCNIIYHLASYLPIANQKGKSKSIMFDINVTGTEKVVQSATKMGIKKIIFTSSTAIYGIPVKNPFNEETEQKPEEEYGISKKLAENVLKEFSENGNHVEIIRPCPVIGPGRLGIFQILFEWIYNNWNIPILGKGENLIQFIHVDDCSKAIILAGENKLGQNIFNAYNIGSEKVLPLRKTLELLIQNSGSKSKIRFLPKKIIIALALLASKLKIIPISTFHIKIYGESVYNINKKANENLSWEPDFSHFEIIDKSYEWYSKNRKQILNIKKGSVHQKPLKQGLMSIVRFLP